MPQILETLLQAWPVAVEQLAIIGHSMGGLLAHSACHYGRRAGHAWLQHLRQLIFLGTPHHGAPLERGGNWVNVILEVSPYTAALARLAKIRSAGITDLRHGSIVDADWKHGDRFAHKKHRTPVPLPAGVKCCAAGATLAAGASAAELPGDGLVPLRSALGQHAEAERSLNFPESQQWVGYGMNHLDLLDSAGVCEQLQKWLA